MQITLTTNSQSKALTNTQLLYNANVVIFILKKKNELKWKFLHLWRSKHKKIKDVLHLASEQIQISNQH